MIAHAVLSMPVVLAAAESQRFRPTQLTVHARYLLDHDRHALQKRLWNCRDNKLAGRQSRKTSESRFTSTCLPRLRLLCKRRPTSASSARVRLGQMSITRATNKVHVDEQLIGSQKSEVQPRFRSTSLAN